MILQIHHGGYKVTTELSYRDRISASASEAEGVREASTAEVDELAASLARAADLTLRAGLDGVEIHGANSYLVQQFYPAQSNRRSDEWGSSLKNRVRFPLTVVDIITAVRGKHQRNDFTIDYRFSPEEASKDGLTMTEIGILIGTLVQRPL